MISHKHKCIFVHIPKTAGQSIEDIFLRLNGLDFNTRSPLLLKPNKDPKLGPERLAHLTASEYIKYSYIPEGSFNSYFKFSFVRNPWARLLSEFIWKKKINSQMKNKLKDKICLDYNAISFNSWLSTVNSIKTDDEFCDSIRHILPQYDFTFDANGNSLVDFIGKFENLQEDFNIICDKIKIPQQQLLHLNKTQHKHYTEYYDDETRSIVAEKYAKDIEYFGYKFGE